jgi:ribosomal protein S18 acetylase RimI-like enzyme
MTIRTANVTDIEKIMLLMNQVFEIHLKARPDWIVKNPMDYDYIKSIIEGNEGKKLFEEVKNYAKEINANFIELMVWDVNQDAKKFYENMGMKTRITRMEYKV